MNSFVLFFIGFVIGFVFTRYWNEIRNLGKKVGEDIKPLVKQ